MKSGKEIEVKCWNKNFKAIAGSVENYKNPTNIYINISSWVKLKNEPISIDSLIRNLRVNIKKLILNIKTVTDN